jgi:hypothetical protein
VTGLTPADALSDVDAVDLDAALVGLEEVEDGVQ